MSKEAPVSAGNDSYADLDRQVCQKKSLDPLFKLHLSIVRGLNHKHSKQVSIELLKRFLSSFFPTVPECSTLVIFNTVKKRLFWSTAFIFGVLGPQRSLLTLSLSLFVRLCSQLKKTVEELNDALASKEEIAQRCHELDMQVNTSAQEAPARTRTLLDVVFSGFASFGSEYARLYLAFFFYLYLNIIINYSSVSATGIFKSLSTADLLTE